MTVTGRRCSVSGLPQPLRGPRVPTPTPPTPVPDPVRDHPEPDPDLSSEREHLSASRAALGRMVEEEEVGRGLVAMLRIPGMTAADIDLSAGMVAR